LLDANEAMLNKGTLKLMQPWLKRESNLSVQINQEQSSFLGHLDILAVHDYSPHCLQTSQLPRGNMYVELHFVKVDKFLVFIERELLNSPPSVTGERGELSRRI